MQTQLLSKLRKRLAAWLILGSIVLSSCSTATENNISEVEGPISDIAAESVEETEKMFMDDLPDDVNMGGRTFNFYLSDTDSIDLGERSIVPYEDNLGDIVNDAVFQRNTRIEDRFNCDINLALSTHWEKLVLDIRPMVASGGSDYDVAAGYQAFSIAAAAEGLLLDLSQSDYLDFEREWWATDLIKNMGVKNKLYWATGDITLKYLGGVSCTFINSTLKEQYIPDVDIYSIVDEGKWTIDTMTKLTEGVYKDINGDGIQDDKDQYGFMMTGEDPVDAMVVGAGISYSVYDENGVPYINCDEERMVSFFEKMLSLFVHNPDAVRGVDDDSKTYMTTFAQGKILFAINKIYMTEFYFRDMEDDYMIVPLPKLDEIQNEYRTATHDGVAIYGIPTTAQNSEQIEMLLEAMAADSKKLVTPAYLDGALKNKYSRDPVTARMLDIILQNTYSDFAMQYHRSVSMISHFYRNALKGKSDNVSSMIARTERAWESTLEELVRKFDTIN